MKQYLVQSKLQKTEKEFENRRSNYFIDSAYESPVKNKGESTNSYILILNVDDNLINPILNEFEKFGQLNTQQYIKSTKGMLLSYVAPENARMAFEHYNPSFNYNMGIEVHLINEEQKRTYLKTIFEEFNEGKHFNDKFNKSAGYIMPNNKDYYNSKSQKSKFQKFLEIFFNI